MLLTVPAYNCASQIGRVIDAIDPTVAQEVERVAVIDNGSTDGTVATAVEHARRSSADVSVWRNRENYGLGGTHKVAFGAAIDGGFDYVAILHGDDQARAAELPRLIARAHREPDAAAVLGSRFSRGSRRIGYSRLRTAGNMGINAVYSAVTMRRTVDLGSGLNVFRVADLRDRAFLAFDDTITFNIDLLLHYFSRRDVLRYEPITWSEEDQVSNARNVAVGRAALVKLWRWRTATVRRDAPRSAYTFEEVL